jgi:hypothetical protein
MKNMGSMSKLMGLLPGASGMKKQLENFDELLLISFISWASNSRILSIFVF